MDSESYAFRKSQLLDECQITPEIFEQVIPRLYLHEALCQRL